MEKVFLQIDQANILKLFTVTPLASPTVLAQFVRTNINSIQAQFVSILEPLFKLTVFWVLED